MKILIVEDLDEKADSVQALLRGALPQSEFIVDRARSYRSGVRHMEKQAYDLLILDLVLPVRDGESPSDQGGKQLLTEILDGTECRRPAHIACLTAFEESAEVVQQELARNLVHLIVYKQDQRWKEPLRAQIQYIQQRLADSDRAPKEHQIDIAIVTSSPDVELREVNKLPGAFVAEYNREDSIYYYRGEWKSKTDKRLSVVACAAPSMGMTAACVTACKVIERWRPRFLVMCGIAAGTAKDQKFGDVLVAEAAYDYGSGKIADLEAGKRIFIPSPLQRHIDAALHALLQQWQRDQTGMDEIRKAWHQQQRESPKLWIGLMASGAAVVQSQELVDEILQESRKVIGLEMEAYAIFQAAELAREPRPRVLVAKSISDFANKKKKDDAQQYAAFTSARFVYEFFTNATELDLGRD